MYSCGANDYGALGINVSEWKNFNTFQEIKMASETQIRRIACGGGHVVLLDSNSSIYSFGANDRKKKIKNK